MLKYGRFSGVCGLFFSNHLSYPVLIKTAPTCESFSENSNLCLGFLTNDLKVQPGLVCDSIVRHYQRGSLTIPIEDLCLAHHTESWEDADAIGILGFRVWEASIPLEQFFNDFLGQGWEYSDTGRRVSLYNNQYIYKISAWHYERNLYARIVETSANGPKNVTFYNEPIISRETVSEFMVNGTPVTLKKITQREGGSLVTLIASFQKNGTYFELTLSGQGFEKMDFNTQLNFYKELAAVFIDSSY